MYGDRLEKEVGGEKGVRGKALYNECQLEGIIESEKPLFCSHHNLFSQKNPIDGC